MKTKMRWKKGYAVVLALSLMAGMCLMQMRSWAAVAIDTEKKDCSIKVSVGENEFREDFDEMHIPVSLYKVADVDATGTFTATGAFSMMDFGQISDKTTAEEWLNLAGEAVGCLGLDKADDAEAGETAGSGTGVEAVAPVATATIEKSAGSQAASATFENLETGMYLVVPQETFNPDYTVKYVFTPYLTALPSSEYTTNLGAGGQGVGSDDWNYNTEIGLKAAAEQQYGQLSITKTLANYNESLGRATFVFEVEGRDETNTVVYSNVISSTHDGAGSQTVVLDRIPAGLAVTVRELYSGASYTIVGEDAQTALIVSDAGIEATAGMPEEMSAAAVGFTNQYDGGNRGGYGVTNHFESDGEDGWTWENPTNPAQ